MMINASDRYLTRIRDVELYSFLKNRSEYEVSFTGTTRGYSVGIVDIVNSTAITAKLTNGKMCEYYSIFLNAMSKIIKAHDATIIKNLGDSLLYYFPRTVDGIEPQGFADVLECSLSMIESRDIINKIMSEYYLPTFDFRVSADYGPVSIASSSRSQVEDVFGPTVNLCAKINRAARPNSVIIGGDLHQIVRSFRCYKFQPIGEYMCGLKLNYPAYSVDRKEQKRIYQLDN
jgi:class 3 adenylate cyclase